MKRFFLDSSAVVKLYVTEPGSQIVRDLVRRASHEASGERILVCDLALPETVSALQQIARGPAAARKGISVAALRQTLPRVKVDLGTESQLVVNQVSECIVGGTGIVERQQLRPGDALHVAAALRVRDGAPPEDDLTFVSADVKQCEAARREGLQVLQLPGA